MSRMARSKKRKQKRYQGTKVSSWWQFLHFSSLRTHISFSLLLELGTPWGAEWHLTGGSGIMPQGPGDRLWGHSPKWDCSFPRLSAWDPLVMRKLEARWLLWPQHLFHPIWVLAGKTLPTREDKAPSPKQASSAATDQWSSRQWRTGWPLPAISSLSLRLWLFGPGERRSQLQHARSQGSVEAGRSPFHLQESWAAIYFAFNSSWAYSEDYITHESTKGEIQNMYSKGDIGSVQGFKPEWSKTKCRASWGSLVKNSPASAGDTDWFDPWSRKMPRALEQVNPCACWTCALELGSCKLLSPCAATTEAHMP